MKQALKAFWALALVALASVAGAQRAPASLDEIITALTSDDMGERRDARVWLEQYLDRDPASRPKEIKNLLGRLTTTSDYRTQLGIAVALSQLKTPWETPDQHADITAVYAMMQRTDDETLRRSLDDALANAKGLYFDAINDYNSMELSGPSIDPDQVRSVEAKFLAMANWPDSAYSTNAIFYLGQYLARAATIARTVDPTQTDALLARSDQNFEKYIDLSSGKASRRSDFASDAYFFHALNEVIGGRTKQALDRLSKVPDTADQRIYVYQFFFSRAYGSVVDRSFDARQLVDMTSKYVSVAGDKAIERQAELIKTLRGIK
jgi:hypothetical protein